jgi:3alpha(or 20beta)-hydroxysteroid dehydrogenase
VDGVPGRLQGSVAFITGAARGMGAAEAQLFVAEGARVVVADVLVDDGKALAERLGAAATFVELDVTDEAAWVSAVETTTAWGGPIDILVNNAGVGHVKPLAALTVESFERVIAVNQVGVFLGMKSLARSMAERGAGSIVNVSSVLGLIGSSGSLAYAATKFSVTGMTKVAALELAAHGVRVNSVHPGVIDTPMSAGASPGSSFLLDPPMGRIGRPEEVAHLVLFLASSESSYCTGAEFVIDGGLTAGSVNDIERSWVAKALRLEVPS